MGYCGHLLRVPRLHRDRRAGRFAKISPRDRDHDEILTFGRNFDLLG